ncbi:hypothetical protein AOC36_09095 [Erysipelothrix larvae]|uniref:Diguanylate cyclase n=1 Tax=Erysipelothrix larvae TaxID=1514105 RepID=A0A109UHE0_9FIRM|nr:GGDEF domain-containing protein [Erysipelothrix larvae]AMC94138.1 hypothetical protein AOC36_09095 [Erysipelothrix larvae]
MKNRNRNSRNLFYGGSEPFDELKVIQEYQTLQDFRHDTSVMRNHLAGVLYLLDHSPLGIYVTDLRGVITWTNAAVHVITGYSREELHGHNMKILQSGHQDHLFYEAMWADILSHGTWEGEIWNRRKNGEIYYQWMRISSVSNHEGEPYGYASVVFDMSYRNHIQHTFNERLYVDGLTDLPSQQQLRQDINYLLTEKNKREMKHALILLNMNYFHEVNLCYGYRSGDEVLKEIARRLENAVGSRARIYRFRNDIFAVFIDHIEAHEVITTMIDDVYVCFEKPFEIYDKLVEMSPSFGISLYPDDGQTVDDIIGSAEIALNAAKHAENHFIQFSNALLNEKAIRRLLLGDAIQTAIENDEFEMHYQVIVDNENECPVGAEALIRWHHDQLGFVSPHEFISYSENTGLMIPLGNWIIEHVFHDMKHIKKRSTKQDFYMSINLSGKQIEDPNFVEIVKSLAHQYHIDPKDVVFEITERVAMNNVSKTQSICKQLKQIGFRLALDDFGKGESSLSFLSDFEVDIVKIDKMFITGIHDQNYKRRLTQAIFDLCSHIGVQTVAEGVETLEDRTFLKELKCKNLQGFFFSKPKSLQPFIKWLNQMCT